MNWPEICQKSAFLFRLGRAAAKAPLPIHPKECADTTVIGTLLPVAFNLQDGW